jgi:hypothetical protein
MNDLPTLPKLQNGDIFVNKLEENIEFNKLKDIEKNNMNDDVLATEGIYNNPLDSLFGGSKYNDNTEDTTSATSLFGQHGGQRDKNDDYYKLKYLKYKTKVMKIRSQL